MAYNGNHINLFPWYSLPYFLNGVTNTLLILIYGNKCEPGSKKIWRIPKFVKPFIQEFQLTFPAWPRVLPVGVPAYRQAGCILLPDKNLATLLFKLVRKYSNPDMESTLPKFPKQLKKQKSRLLPLCLYFLVKRGVIKILYYAWHR